MKRISAIIFAIILIVSLVACGDYSGEEVKKPSDVIIGDNTGDNQPGGQAGKTEEPGKTEITISETVMVDEAGVKIIAKSLEADALFGPEVRLFIENNSGKDLTFQCGYAAVNGYMVETVMSIDVVNGKKANDSLTFMKSDFEICGIDAIADMEIAFHIFDTAGWEAIADTEVVRMAF